MRIALTNDIYKPGGAVGLLADRFARALRDAGHDTTLICGVDEKIGGPPEDINSMTWDYPTRGRGLRAQLRFYRELRQRSAIAFRRWMEKGDADAWMCIVPPSGYGAWQVGGKKIPYLYMANSPWAQEWLTAYRQEHGKEAGGLKRLLSVWPRRRLERKLVQNASAWLALSPTQLAWMAAEHGRCAGVKKHVIEAGVDCQETRSPDTATRETWRDQACEKYEIPKESRILICSRRLVPRTGVNVLVEALQQLPEDVYLIVTGDGPERPKLEVLSKQIDLTSRVKFTGIVPFDELMRLTAVARFSVMPTQELEGFGLSAAEAFASGTPVVATPVGALPDVVGGLDKALISHAIDAESIARTLIELLDDPKWEGEEARKRARKYAESRFDWQEHQSTFVAACEALQL